MLVCDEWVDVTANQWRCSTKTLCCINLTMMLASVRLGHLKLPVMWGSTISPRQSRHVIAFGHSRILCLSCPHLMQSLLRSWSVHSKPLWPNFQHLKHLTWTVASLRLHTHQPTFSLPGLRTRSFADRGTLNVAFCVPFVLPSRTLISLWSMSIASCCLRASAISSATVISSRWAFSIITVGTSDLTLALPFKAFLMPASFLIPAPLLYLSSIPAACRHSAFSASWQPGRRHL